MQFAFGLLSSKLGDACGRKSGFWSLGLVALLALLALLAGDRSTAADNVSSDASPLPKPTLQSGREVGETVPRFYVRAVTGPLANRSVCYVCRNGDRPVVMVLLRDCLPELPPLLTGLDEVIDQNRAVGLRGFGVLIAPDQQTAVSKLQTLVKPSSPRQRRCSSKVDQTDCG